MAAKQYDSRKAVSDLSLLLCKEGSLLTRFPQRSYQTELPLQGLGVGRKDGEEKGKSTAFIFYHPSIIIRKQ